MGCAPGRPGLGSPELIAVKIRAPSSPFEPFRKVTRLVEPNRAMSTSGRHVDDVAPRALAVLVLVVAACSSSGASSAPPRSLRPRHRSATERTPSASPETFGAIEHKTGPTDVVLRYERVAGS